MDSSGELALAMVLFFGSVRVLAVIAGLWYQTVVTWDRYTEQRALCSDPSAPLVECSISTWHFERGLILLAVHVLLGMLTALAWWGRAQLPPPQHLEIDMLLLRAAGDLVFTAIVVLLAVVSFRAHVHHMRQLKLLAEQEVKGKMEPELS